MGVVRMRLARFGSRNRPFYRVVAVDSRAAREAKPIETLGTYDPLPAALDGAKEVRLKVDRVKYWLAVGAQPSSRVAYLLWRGGLLAAPPAIRFAPESAAPKKKNAERIAKAAAAATAATAAAAAAAAAAAPAKAAAPAAGKAAFHSFAAARLGSGAGEGAGAGAGAGAGDVVRASPLGFVFARRGGLAGEALR